MAYPRGPAGSIRQLLKVVPLGLDAFSELRYLHTTALRAQTACVLSEAEVAAFTALVRSPAYVDLLLKEEIYGGFLHGELVGSISWHSSGDSSTIARIGSLVCLHSRLGVGAQAAR